MSLGQTNQWLKLTRISSDCSTTTTNLTHLYQQNQNRINFMACTFSWGQESKDNILVTWTTSIKRSTLKSPGGRWRGVPDESVISCPQPFLAQDIGWKREMTEERVNSSFQNVDGCVECLEIFSQLYLLYLTQMLFGRQSTTKVFLPT